MGRVRSFPRLPREGVSFDVSRRLPLSFRVGPLKPVSALWTAIRSWRSRRSTLMGSSMCGRVPTNRSSRFCWLRTKVAPISLRAARNASSSMELYSLTDVVPVDPRTVDEWEHPPYSGHFDGKSHSYFVFPTLRCDSDRTTTCRRECVGERKL